MLLATVLNYMDRQVMSVVAPAVQEEFHLSKEQMGYIFAFFFWSYALFQTPVGWWLDKGRTVVGYAVAVAVWSIAGLLTPLSRTVPALKACRVLLGAAEAANWPAAMILVRRMFSPEDRALANGIFTSGSGLGAMVTPPLVAVMLAHWGWRPPFLLLGALGFVWIALWVAVFSCSPLKVFKGQAQPGGDRRATDWKAIFSSRLFYALLVIALTNNSYWYFIVNWLPTYLVDERGFSFIKMGFAAAVPFLGQDVGNWLGGFVTRVVAGKLSVESGRRVAMTLGAICAAMIWAAAPAHNAAWCLAILFFGTMGQGMIGSNYLAYCQDVSPEDTGAVAGLLGGAGAVA
ncbi:MAG: MFS transporter, partial [Armatimonadetes bacterium]|nr:MFS transporter [Armatimonadota bacterium]